MPATNPFTERGRITNPERFIGRWSELGLIFERIEAGRPVLVIGTPGVGTSSLLTHMTQAAAVNLETPELRAYYLDMAQAEDAAQIYGTLANAIGQRGDTLAAFELGLVALGDPVLVCLDNAQAALAAGWGVSLLEALARIVRGGQFMLVVGLCGTPPDFSERFATVKLGAFAPTEVRLLVETYLDDTDVSFSPLETREISELSGGHPAYVQRAAYHLFQSKIEPGYDWRASYRAEARERPVPGAPLPPAVFEGGQSSIGQSRYGDTARETAPRAMPQRRALPEIVPLAGAAVGLAAMVLVVLLTNSWVLGIAAGLVGLLLAALWARSRRA